MFYCCKMFKTLILVSIYFQIKLFLPEKYRSPKLPGIITLFKKIRKEQLNRMPHILTSKTNKKNLSKGDTMNENNTHKRN